MDTDIWGIIALIAFASPVIALPIIVIVKIWSAVKKRRQKLTVVDNVPMSNHDIFAPKIIEQLRAESTTENFANTEKSFYKSTVKPILLFLVAIIISILGGVLTGIAAAFIGSFFYIAFLFPLVMGFAGGNGLRAPIQLAKIRKTSQVIFMSILMAVSIYGTYHYGRYVILQVQTSLKVFSNLSEATDDENMKAAKIIVDYALKQETGHSGFAGYMIYKAQQGVSLGRIYRSSRLNLGPVFTWVYWLLEFGIIFWVTISIARREAQIPVCEVCGNQLDRERHLGGTTPANESLLLDMINRREFVELKKLIEKNADLPSTELYMQSCKVCNKGNSHLTIRRAFRNAKGALQFTDILNLPLLPKDGTLFLRQLGSKIE